jgi:pyridoxal phosphate enzyme (YggS family)
MNSLDNYKAIKLEVDKLKNKHNLIVVTKNKSIETILPIIKNGHLHFGENRVQEAKEKWIPILKNYKDIKLHLIGKLQSNKAKDAFALFDFIHTLDSDKLAKKFSELELNSERKIKYFIQINIGNEAQKNGIEYVRAKNFINFCKNDLKLNIIGLMCIPPINLDPRPFFEKMQQLKINNNLNDLSMGMSSDYKEALNFGSTYIRIGSAIFKQYS